MMTSQVLTEVGGVSECGQTEALTHQTMPWTGAGERRTVFFKYSPKALTWSSVSFLRLQLLSIDSFAQSGNRPS